MTPKNLARSKRLDPEALRPQYLLDDMFSGDHAALDVMRDASNGFEHGYMAVDDVRGLIKPALEHSMSLVRRARLSWPRGLTPRCRSVSLTASTTSLADSFRPSSS